MAETMRALVVDRWGEAPSLQQVPVPSPGDGEVLLKVKACGIGLTVLNVINGDLSNRAPEQLPRIPGHEVAGEVVALGPGVVGMQPGDRVVAYFYVTCGTCAMCRSSREPLCENFRGFLGSQWDGGYAEYMRLPARNCFKIPAEMDYVTATAVPDAVLTPVHVVRSRARVRPGDRVVVIGAGGGVGIHMVQVARLFGGEVWGVDANPSKRQDVLAAGATAAVEFQAIPAEAMREMTGGATVVIDLVGRPETLSWSLQVLTRSGRLVLMTTFPGLTGVLNPRDLVLSEQTILGSRYASHYELGVAIDLVARGRIRPVITRTVPLERVEEVHQLLREGTLVGRGAVVFD